MSVWCCVEGKAIGENLSIRKAVDSVFDEYCMDKNVALPNFRFSFSEDGEGAVRFIKRFIAILDSYEAKYDLNTTIRWLR